MPSHTRKERLKKLLKKGADILLAPDRKVREFFRKRAERELSRERGDVRVELTPPKHTPGVPMPRYDPEAEKKRRERLRELIRKGDYNALMREGFIQTN